MKGGQHKGKKVQKMAMVVTRNNWRKIKSLKIRVMHLAKFKLIKSTKKSILVLQYLYVILKSKWASY